MDGRLNLNIFYRHIIKHIRNWGDMINRRVLIVLIIIVLALFLALSINNISIMPTVDDSIDANNSTEAIDNQKSNLSLVASDVNMTKGEDVNYTVQVVDGEGNPLHLEGEKVKITLKNKTYERKIDDEGIATLPINLDEGNYTFTVQYDGEEITSNIIVNSA